MDYFEADKLVDQFAAITLKDLRNTVDIGNAYANLSGQMKAMLAYALSGRSDLVIDIMRTTIIDKVEVNHG